MSIITVTIVVAVYGNIVNCLLTLHLVLNQFYNVNFNFKVK